MSLHSAIDSPLPLGGKPSGLFESFEKSLEKVKLDKLEKVTISLKETEDMLLDKLKSMRGPL